MKLNARLPSRAQAFAIPGLSRRIYAYATTRKEVVDACYDLAGIMPHRMKLVPEEDRRSVWDLFRLRQIVPVAEPDSFARVRQGQYMGDIAYVPLAANSTLPSTTREDAQPVDDVQTDDLLTLWVVPRLDLSFNTKPNPSADDYRFRSSKRRRISEKGKEKEKERPEPTPFDPKNVRDCLRRQNLEDDPKYAVVEHSERRYTFMDRTFENGFERLRVFGMHAVKSIQRPSLEQVAAFIGFGAAATRITNAAFTRVGDRVRVKKTWTGTIQSSTNSTFSVRLDWEIDGKTVQEVKAGDFERLFELGEWVEIKLGPDVGCSGPVVALEGPYLTMADRAYQKMVKLLNYLCRHYSNYGLQRYDIHRDRVQHSAGAMVYKTRRQRRNEVELKTYARTSGLVDKNEMIASFVGKEVYVLRGSGKGRIGRTVGVGSESATVVFDGSQSHHKVGLTDAVNL